MWVATWHRRDGWRGARHLRFNETPTRKKLDKLPGDRVLRTSEFSSACLHLIFLALRHLGTYLHMVCSNMLDEIHTLIALALRYSIPFTVRGSSTSSATRKTLPTRTTQLSIVSRSTEISTAKHSWYSNQGIQHQLTPTALSIFLSKESTLLIFHITRGKKDSKP